jgi:hypothetical protein
VAPAPGHRTARSRHTRGGTVLFTTVNRQGHVYYLHVTPPLGAAFPQQYRYYFSRSPERALVDLPAGFVLGGEVPRTGVPILRKAATLDRR